MILSKQRIYKGRSGRNTYLINHPVKNEKTWKTCQLVSRVIYTTITRSLSLLVTNYQYLLLLMLLLLFYCCNTHITGTSSCSLLVVSNIDVITTHSSKIHVFHVLSMFSPVKYVFTRLIRVDPCQFCVPIISFVLPIGSKTRLVHKVSVNFEYTGLSLHVKHHFTFKFPIF